MVIPPIRLLGSVEVASASRPRSARFCDLGPARQRAVLTVLLLAAPHAVAVEDLIDRVWGEDLPIEARGSVRAHICRVRKAVLASRVLSVDRIGNGYRATFDSGDLDLGQFRAGVARARTAVQVGELEDAYANLTAALELWGGSALGGVDSPWLSEQRTALACERRGVAAQRFDLAIRLGEHVEVIPELMHDSAAEPYDELLAGQLMLALRATGRATEALTVYDRMRRRLRTELGAEPGGALRGIHQRVLRPDFAAAPDARVVPRRIVPRRVVPHQLPPAASIWVDRVAERAAMDRARIPGAEASAQTIILTGIGGAGKTSLAVEWAQAQVEDFPDGQLFVDLQGFDAERYPMSTESALRTMLLALSGDSEDLPPDLNGLTGRYRTMLAGRKVLVIIDNARTSAQVRALLPPSPSAAVITSRSSLNGLLADPGATLIPVGMLAAEDAEKLIEKRIGRERVRAEREAMLQLVRHCAGLPLALAIVAGQAAASAHLPLAILAEELADEAARLDGLGGEDRACDVRSALQVSVAALSADAARVFGWLGLCPGPTTHRAAFVLASGLSSAAVTGALRELTRVHLVRQQLGDRLSMHDLVRLYAAERGREDPEAARVIRRLLRSFVESAQLAGPAGESAEPTTDTTFVESQACELVAALDLAAALGHDDLVGDLAAVLQRHLGVRGCWSELVRTSTAAIAAARRLGDERRTVRGLVALARGQIGLSDYAGAGAALSEAVLALGDLDEPALEASAQRALGRLSARQNRHEPALAHDHQALVLFRRVGDRDGEATSLNAIGWHLAHLRRPATGLACCRRALSLFEQTGNRRGQAMTLDSVGYALDRLGRSSEAQHTYRRASELMAETGADLASAETLRLLAASYRSCGDLAAAALAEGGAEAALVRTGGLGGEPPVVGAAG